MERNRNRAAQKQLSEIDYNLEAVRNVVCVDI